MRRKEEVTDVNADMLRILSWNSNTGFEKMPSEDELSHVPNCTVPGLSSANLSGKRKRSFAIEKPDMMAIFNEESRPPLPVSSECSTISQEHLIPQPTPPCVLPATSGTPNVVSQDVSESVSEKVKSKGEAQLATMRQTISSQLSLEILMKHKELRLIDQELAKCQIALEQLRRCAEIPYPALQQPSEQVSAGSGAAVRKGPQKSQARSPAPWGVIEGPYSRHYAKWLMSDPRFDGGEPEMVTPVSAMATPAHGRSTRGVFTDFAQMVGKTSRSQRALHQGLPAGFVEPKQKPTGPMILKRKSDGKMVKLVCPDCARFDFGSAQGFINHCRIGHQRNFASHDAAAEGCGQLLEGDEGLPTQAVTPAESVPTPVAMTPVTPITPSLPLACTNTTTHPLVKSAHAITKEHLARPLVPGGFLPKSERKSSQAKIEPPQIQCAQTPNLSAFITARGLELDLQDAVDDAKSKDGLYEESEVEIEMDLDSPMPEAEGHRRHPVSSGKKPSAKSLNANAGARKPSFNQSRNTSLPSVHTGISEHDFGDFTPLLPSPTNESTQAPSLIDDDEEMDAGSPPSSDEHDDTDVHFHVRDDDHPEDNHELRGAELPSPTGACTQSQTANQPAISAPSAYVHAPVTKEVRQYNFIAERPMDNDTGDKKRRRIGGANK